MPLVVYSLLRLAVLGVALGLGYLAGLRSWLLVIVATVVAALVSYLLLRGPRDAAAARLAEAAGRRRDAPRGTDEDVEDDADEAARAQAEVARPAAAPDPSAGAADTAADTDVDTGADTDRREAR